MVPVSVNKFVEVEPLLTIEWIGDIILLLFQGNDGKENNILFIVAPAASPELLLATNFAIYDIDGTNGTWTIQEGEENLYIINNNNGKKYKIDLTEII